MSTKRTPLNRDQRRRITPRAVELFRDLKAAGPGDAWWSVHNALHDEIGGRPWEWPCLESPDAERNYPPKREALALWQELEAAT